MLIQIANPPFNIGDTVILSLNGSYQEVKVNSFYAAVTGSEIYVRPLVGWTDINNQYQCKIVEFSDLYHSKEEVFESLEKEAIL